MDNSRGAQQQCDSLKLRIVTRGLKLPIMRNKELNIINLLISVNIFMISFLPSLSRTFVADCLKSRYGSFTVISAKPCSNAVGQVGTCMFMWDCIKTEGLHLGTCSDRFLFGSCCYHNLTFNDIDIQRSNTTLSSIINESSASSSSSSANFTSSLTTQSTTISFLQSASSSSSEHLANANTPTRPNKYNSPTSSQVLDSVHHIKFNDTKDVYLHQPQKQNQWNNESPIVNASAYTNQLQPSSLMMQSLPISTTSPSANSTPSPPSPPSSTAMITTYTSTTSTPLAATSTSTTSNLPLGSDSAQPLESSAQVSQIYNSRPQMTQAEQTVSSINYQQRPTINHSNSNADQLVSPLNNQPQKPTGFWFKPATALANAFLHTFRPFSYPSQSRLRPTYRPYMNGYRPQYQRPNIFSSNQTPNKPHIQTPTQHSNEQTAGSYNVSSENSFSSINNNYNTSSLTLDATANNFTKPLQENSDHHIVHPNVHSFTNRHRPIDRNSIFSSHYDGGLDVSQTQKQNHYEIVNLNNSQVSNQLSSYNPSTHSFIESQDEQHRPILHHTSPISTLIVDSLVDPSATSNNSGMQVNSKPVIGEVSSGQNVAINNNNNNHDTGLVIPAPSSMEQSKPIVLIESGINESPNFPSYPLITSYPTPTNVQNLPVDSHFSTLSSIDEIHGLSTLTNTILPPIEHNQNINHISSQHHQHQINNYLPKPQHNNLQQDILHDSRPQVGEIIAPTSISGSLNTAQLILSTTLPTVNIPTSTPPSITTTTTTSTRSPVLPSTTSDVPKTFISDPGKRGNVNREAACGVTAMLPQTKVVGGKNAAFGAWPWQVSVRKSSLFGLASTHRCGGAVISSEWIATAGHCVEDLALQSIRIRVGEYDFSSVAEPFPYIERAAKRKVVHPKYTYYTYENDLALVQLDQPIKFPPHVGPICLPPDNIDLLGKNATVTGWGRLSENGILPSILQEVRVPIVSNDKCRDMFLNANRPEYIPDIFLCAGYEEGGRDSCQGDSGGPLQVKGDDGKWFLAGIISWGIGCAERNLPGVCTRISRFKLWIQTTMSSSG